MTRKDFEAVAKVIRETFAEAIAEEQRTGKPRPSFLLHSRLSHAMSAELWATNTRFDAVRFVAACAVEG